MAESYGPISNQRINQSTTIRLADGEHKSLNAGTYVKAISKTYMPHGHPLADFDEDTYVAVYSPYGLGLVNRWTVDWNVY